MKDAKPKANSRGLFSPWKQEGMLSKIESHFFAKTNFYM